MEGLMLAVPGPLQWGLMTLVVGIVTLYTIFIYTILHAPAPALTKLFWTVVVLVIPLLGVLAYLLLRKVISIDVVNSGK